MTDCESIRRELALLLYGELSFDQEERVESHLDHCGECREALERERAMHAAADRIEITPSPTLLRECREDLFLRLAEEPAPASSSGWWDKFVDAIALRPSAGPVLGACIHSVGLLRPCPPLDELVIRGFERVPAAVQAVA